MMSNMEGIIDLHGISNIGEVKLSPCVKCKYRSNCSVKRSNACTKQ